MKRKFLKILIFFSLIFTLFMSFNRSNNLFLNENTINCSTNISNYFIETNNDTNYCFSVSKQITIIDVSLNNSQYRLRNKEIDEIVIHHSAGENTTIEDIDRIHSENGWGGIGYNFYIRSDGNIYKGRDISYSGAHCIGKNDNSIGICLEGNFDNHKPSNEQLESLLALTKKLSLEYNIKIVSAHKDNYATNCPGEYFPWDLFINVYNNIMNE